MNLINVMGCDGSLRNFGLSVATIDLDKYEVKDLITLSLNETEVDKTKGVKKSDDDLSRFKSHWEFLKQNIYTYDISMAFAEVPYGGQDARAAFAFGGVTALYACLPVNLVALTPTQVKAATGDKHNDKEDIIEWAYNKYPHKDWFISKRSNKMDIRTPEGLYLQTKNEHLADSVAAIEAGLLKLKNK